MINDHTSIQLLGGLSIVLFVVILYLLYTKKDDTECAKPVACAKLPDCPKQSDCPIPKVSTVYPLEHAFTVQLVNLARMIYKTEGEVLHMIWNGYASVRSTYEMRQNMFIPSNQQRQQPWQYQQRQQPWQYQQPSFTSSDEPPPPPPPWMTMEGVHYSKFLVWIREDARIEELYASLNKGYPISRSMIPAFRDLHAAAVPLIEQMAKRVYEKHGKDGIILGENVSEERLMYYITTGMEAWKFADGISPLIRLFENILLES
jgi:hypothetical protein